MAHLEARTVGYNPLGGRHASLGGVHLREVNLDGSLGESMPVDEAALKAAIAARDEAIRRGAGHEAAKMAARNAARMTAVPSMADHARAQDAMAYPVPNAVSADLMRVLTAKRGAENDVQRWIREAGMWKDEVLRTRGQAKSLLDSGRREDAGAMIMSHLSKGREMYSAAGKLAKAVAVRNTWDPAIDYWRRALAASEAMQRATRAGPELEAARAAVRVWTERARAATAKAQAAAAKEIRIAVPEKLTKQNLLAVAHAYGQQLIPTATPGPICGGCPKDMRFPLRYGLSGFNELTAELGGGHIGQAFAGAALGSIDALNAALDGQLADLWSDLDHLGGQVVNFFADAIGPEARKAVDDIRKAYSSTGLPTATDVARQQAAEAQKKQAEADAARIAQEQRDAEAKGVALKQGASFVERAEAAALQAEMAAGSGNTAEASRQYNVTLAIRQEATASLGTKGGAAARVRQQVLSQIDVFVNRASRAVENSRTNAGRQEAAAGGGLKWYHWVGIAVAGVLGIGVTYSVVK